MSTTRFVLASLAVWRVTHLLAAEDGPGDAVLWLRARAGNGPLGKLMDCFLCISVWVSAPASLAVAKRRRDLPLAWFALSGAACLLERATDRRALGDAAVTLAGEHPSYDLLRNRPEGAADELVFGGGAHPGGP